MTRKENLTKIISSSREAVCVFRSPWMLPRSTEVPGCLETSSSPYQHMIDPLSEFIPMTVNLRFYRGQRLNEGDSPDLKRALVELTKDL